ncbi:hypothetical protein FAVG1_13209 [Fusarium avenaceum]|nr:hypothetical protein FAVG1_13209 [Fusarium avenaceum]
MHAAFQISIKRILPRASYPFTVLLTLMITIIVVLIFVSISVSVFIFVLILFLTFCLLAAMEFAIVSADNLIGLKLFRKII